MRARTFLSLLPLGAALSAVAGSVAAAQPGIVATVCRDGAQTASRNPRVCRGHGGVDVRATQVARQSAYNGGGYNNGVYNGRVGPYTSEKYGGTGNGQSPSLKYGGAYGNGASNNGAYNGAYNGAPNADDRARRDAWRRAHQADGADVRRPQHDGRQDDGRQHDDRRGDHGRN